MATVFGPDFQTTTSIELVYLAEYSFPQCLERIDSTVNGLRTFTVRVKQFDFEILQEQVRDKELPVLFGALCEAVGVVRTRLSHAKRNGCWQKREEHSNGKSTRPKLQA